MNKRQARRRLQRWGLVFVTALLIFSVILVFARFLLGERPQDVRPVAVVTGEWEPFVGPNLDAGGPVAEIMADVLEGADFDAHLSFTSWETVEQRVIGGSVFGGFPLVGSETRREHMILSDPILSFDYVLYMRANAKNVPGSANDVGDLRVGGVTGYDYWSALEQVVTISTYPNTSEGFRALAAGDIDVFVEGELTAEANLKDPASEFDRSMFQIVGDDEPWARSEQNLYFMMGSSREAASVMERVNASLDAVKQTTEYTQRVASLNGASADDVRIIAADDHLVPVMDRAGDPIGHTVPGSRARVLDWGPQAAPFTADRLVSVKFASGNLAGTIGWVRAQYLEVE